MKRRQFSLSPFSVAAEVLEVRALLSAAVVQSAVQTGVVGQLSTHTPVVATTIASNGDVNPYGAAFVPQGFAKGGPLNPGDLLVSNFNSATGGQATGMTIVRVTPSGDTSTFFQGPSGLGLSTALGVLKNGYVIVGNTPLANSGTTVKQGSLLILDKNGHVVETLTDNHLLDGPWDLTINDQGNFAQIFVSNVLNGTVSRIDLQVPTNGSKPKVLSETQIASGYAHGTDPNALVVGPTGLAFDAKTDTLFVASTKDNAIYAIHNALTTNGQSGKGTLIYNGFNSQHPLHGPLALVLTPSGNLIASNGDAVNSDPTKPQTFNLLIEITQQGKFVSQYQVDPGPVGAAFGIALQTSNDKLHFAAVNDNQNQVDIWTLND